MGTAFKNAIALVKELLFTVCVTKETGQAWLIYGSLRI